MTRETEPWIVVAWLTLVVGASILFRHSRGRPLFAVTPNSATFVERWASGNSNGHVVAMLGGASNCLFVAVTPSELIVRLQFPFSLMFLPEIFDLEHTIPRRDILSAEMVHRWFGSPIEVKFKTKSGESQSLFLHLRRWELFLHAVRNK